MTLTREDIHATADTLAAAQRPDGLILWTPDGEGDPWNHLEVCMALNVAGRRREADLGLTWYAAAQRADGSLPLRLHGDTVSDASGCTNATAYAAMALWHHWLTWADEAALHEWWPMVDRGLDHVCALQLEWGGIAWSQEWRDGEPAAINREALVAGSSSVWSSLRAGLALADLVGVARPAWQQAADRLRVALVAHEDLFLDKSEFSMDWYYPVLSGAMTGSAATDRLAARWSQFVEPTGAVRCVASQPWVTGAETAELALALMASGDDQRALAAWESTHGLRTESGAYWTGEVLPEGVKWPVEQSTYTAAAVVLAWDALIGRSPAAAALTGGGGPQ